MTDIEKQLAVMAKALLLIIGRDITSVMGRSAGGEDARGVRRESQDGGVAL